MNINATLIIQACNFFIAYTMLRFLFFKPVLAIIRQDQAHLDGLIGQVNEKRKTILALEQSRQEQWRAAQQEFRNRLPDVTSTHLHVFKGIAPEREISFIDDLHIKQLESELTKDIIERVKHAHN